MQNIESLIDGISFLKSKGFLIEFNVEGSNLVYPDSKVKVPIKEVEAVYTIKIEADSDADNTSYILGLVTPNGDKGLIIDEPGIYGEFKKSKPID